MENPFPYSDTNKRYHAYSYYLKKRYGEKVAKIPLDGGFTCPNRDGTKGTGGCTYCSGRGSGDFAPESVLPLAQQFDIARTSEDKKWRDLRYIAYFQAFTGTYAPVEVLRKKYKQALALPGVVGLNIATRADCISADTADLLEEISQKTDLTIELGLQTIFDETAACINRCHTYAEFLNGLSLLSHRHIPVCVHIIDGLPGETHDMMLQTAKAVAKMPVQSIKIHLLHVLRNTPLAQQRYTLLSKEEYVRIICDQLEVLPPEIVIQRLTGDGKASDLIGPMWSIQKMAVLNEIDKELVRRNSFQGKYAE